ncbi:MAG TPA: RNA pseudouridine synthase [Saprospiraceae bacterium]|nr:RNA pseudouridine synthase [Saprospiraceae bacterium]
MESNKIGDWVIFKTNQFIAFNKPPAVPVQPDKTGEKSLQALAEIYCKHPVLLVHRIDMPASGLVLFANKKSALAAINEQFQNRTVRKLYLAVVKEQPPKTEDTLVHFLRKNGRTNRSEAFDHEAEGSKKAELHYKVINQSDNYFLLEIELLTGRHHQIRAQLAAIGCPIRGDVKYGFKRSNPDRSIHLHAWKMEFSHPVTGETVHLEAPLPEGDPVWDALKF